MPAAPLRLILLAAWLLLAATAHGAPAWSAEEAAWLRAHPVLRYSAAADSPPLSQVREGRHAGYGADHLHLLAERLGVRLEFVPTPSLQEALKAARERRIDLVGPMEGFPLRDPSLRLVPLGPGLSGAEEGARPLVVVVRDDWQPLAALLGKARDDLDPAALESARLRWRDAPEPGYSGRQVALLVLTLTAGAVALTLLVVLWSARKRRGLARDIERSEALFNAFFNASPAGMAILDRELRVVRINETQARMHGHPAAECEGRAIERLAPDLATVVAPLMREVMVTGRAIHNVEVAGPAAAGGPEGHWLASFFPVHSRPGRIPLGVGQVMLDIGDRKRAELALRESENRLRNVSNHLPVAVFQYQLGETPAEDAFSYLSEGVQRLLGHAPQALLAQPRLFLDALHGEDRGGLVALLESQRRRDGGGEVEWTGRRAAGGDEAWLQIRASAERGPGGRIALSGIILDITQLKGVQQALERSRADLRRLSAHREGIIEREHQRLAREFHDELGQVLTTARMHLRMLEQNMGAAPPAGADALRAAVHDIDAMVADAYRSVKTIASDLRPAALNLGLTAAVEWLAGRVLGPAGIRYAIAFDRAADGLDGDHAIVLFRIVQESLTNILRHAEASNVRIGLEVEEDGVRLDIGDNGKGFDAAAVDRARRFGLLGMAERVAALGGTLDIDSRPGAGTRLHIHLPIAPAPAPLPAPQPDRSPAP